MGFKNGIRELRLAFSEPDGRHHGFPAIAIKLMGLTAENSLDQ
jgi:hypothetical protein